MTTNNEDLERLGQRAGEVLRAGAEDLDSATRSRLAQARATALERAAAPRHWLSLRYLAPVGALASAALVALLFVFPDRARDGVNAAAPAALQDLEFLADADAWELSQEADLEFIEWAAAMAEMEGSGG